MATEVIKDLFLTQYKDDYKDSDNYPYSHPYIE